MWIKDWNLMPLRYIIAIIIGWLVWKSWVTIKNIDSVQQ